MYVNCLLYKNKETNFNCRTLRTCTKEPCLCTRNFVLCEGGPMPLRDLYQSTLKVPVINGLAKFIIFIHFINFHCFVTFKILNLKYECVWHKKIFYQTSTCGNQTHFGHGLQKSKHKKNNNNNKFISIN